MTPQPTSPPAARKPSGWSKGCLVGLIVIGGLALLSCLLGVVVLLRAAASEDGQKMVKAIGKGVNIAAKGATAPGVEEVRGAGCPQAFILDAAETLELGKLFRDAGTGRIRAGVIVMCQGYFTTAPSCGDVAAAYLTAKGRPPGEFAVMVKERAQKRSLCARRYSETGEDLGLFGSGGTEAD